MQSMSKAWAIIKSKNYKEVGHDIRTCRSPHVSDPVKVPTGNKGGRPKKKQKALNYLK